MSDYSDDYDSTGEKSEEELSLRSNDSRTVKHGAKRPQSARVPKKIKAGGRPGSAPPKPRASSASKTARELWSNAVKPGSSMSAGPKRGGAKSATEMWSDKLRKTGVGMSDTRVSKNSISNLKKSQGKNSAYSSTSHYLRQLVGTEKPKKVTDTGKVAPGTPAYKSQEEYYEEILGLRKQISALSGENSTMKSKVRRLEEDNMKKEKEIDQLLNPGKSDDIRRTLTDRKPDGGAVIQSLKQKILKLEHQLKEKEASYNKLQSDLKTTKVEELRVQMETFYQEIVRITQLKMGEIPKSGRKESVKESGPKLKALQETIMRMNEKNVRLTAENKTLKQDLEKFMNEKAESREREREYEDMSKKQLLNSISKLEQRLDRADADSASLLSDIDSRKGAKEGKLTLEGTVAQKLDQLDRRETELLEELEKQRPIMKRLKDDRAHYRKKVEEKEKEMRNLKKEIEELRMELDEFYERDRKVATPRPSTARAPPRKPSPHGAKGRSRSGSMSSEGSRRDDRERTKKAEALREKHAAKSIQRGWRQHRKDSDEKRWYAQQQRKAVAFQEDRAARKIQHGWRHHRQLGHGDEDLDDATELLQSTMRGHLSRKEMMKSKRFDDDTETVTETDMDSAAETVQSSARGHWGRKEQLSRSRSRDRYDTDDNDLDDAVVTVQSAMRGHLGRKGQGSRGHSRSNTPPSRRGSSGGRYNKRLDSAGEEEDEDDVMSRSSRRQSPGRYSPKTPYTSKRPPVRQRSRATEDSDEDSDDDVVISSRRK